MMDSRREFLKKTALAGGTVAASGYKSLGADFAGQPDKMPEKKSAIRNLRHPVAIAMWDFSWLARTHVDGGFENWDRALDELAERGYNAIRIDVFPHLVALAGNKEIPERITYKGPLTGGHVLWGNDIRVTVNPRQALLEFIPKCQKRGIYISASTWFQQPKIFVEEVPEVKGFDGFTRVWDQTLEFMESNGLLENILFIDFLNEYPAYHGFNWLRDEAKAAAHKAPEKITKAGEQHLPSEKVGELADGERAFYRQFSSDVLKYFHKKRPQYDFAFSLPGAWDRSRPESCCDMSSMDAYDVHLWFSRYPGGVLSELKGSPIRMKPEELKTQYANIKKAWSQNSEKLLKWMDGRMAGFEKTARQYNAIMGNTEGWGTVGWDDVAPLDWDFIKQSAEICANLAIKHNYRFICTSNFTHPHFKRLWADVEWHKSITKKIRNA